MSPSGISDLCGTVAGMVTNRGARQQREGNPSFSPTLQVFDISTLDDAADINPVIKFLD